MSEPTFDPPGYQYVGRAIAAIAAANHVQQTEAVAELRRQLAAGYVKACLVHYKTGALLNIAASAWNVDRCLDWLRNGQAEITAAEWQVWRSPEQRAPLCWLYIETGRDQASIAATPSDPSVEPPNARPLDVSRRAREFADGLPEGTTDLRGKVEVYLRTHNYAGKARDKAQKIVDGLPNKTKRGRPSKV